MNADQSDQSRRVVELEAEVARLREGLAQKNALIVAKNERIWELEHPLLSSRASDEDHLDD